MDRITGKDAKLMMEALASVYAKEEVEQEVISEEVAETEVLEENPLNYLGDKFKKGADQIGGFFNRFSPGPGVNPNRSFSGRGAGRASFRDSNIPANSGIKQSGGGLNQGEKPKPPGGGNQKPLTAKDRAYGPRSTLNQDQQAVNREYDRLRAKDPEAALAYGKKMAARGAARSDFKIEKPTQAQSNPTAAQKQASVDAAIKSVNTPEKMNRPAPVGSALRAQQDKQAAAKAAASAPRPMARPGARNLDRAPGGMASGRPAPKPAANTAVGSAAAAKPAAAGGYQLPAGARPMTAPGRRPMARPGARNRGVYGEELDIFDTIKEHLISEHELSEDIAIQVMTLLDEETRADIMEYTAAIRADAAPKGTTVKMTADGKEPAGDRLLKGIGKKVGGFLNRLNPNALKSTTVEPRKPLVSTQKNSYELEGELVDEGSCGSKKKKKSKKGGY